VSYVGRADCMLPRVMKSAGIKVDRVPVPRYIEMSRGGDLRETGPYTECLSLLTSAVVAA